MKAIKKLLFVIFAGIVLFAGCVVDSPEKTKTDDTNQTENVDDNTGDDTKKDDKASDNSDSGSGTEGDSEDKSGSDAGAGEPEVDGSDGSDDSGDSDDDDDEESEVGKDIYIDLTNQKYSEDNSTWTLLPSEAVKILGETVKVSFNSTTSLLKIDYTTTRTDETIIHISGSLTSGGVKIQTNGSTGPATNVYLNGISITSSNYPCLEITKGGAASIYLKGTNTFVDGRKYGYGYGDSAAVCESSRLGSAEGSDSKGSLYCKGALTIYETSETGSLSVTQAYKNCIATKDDLLTVKSGTITLKNYKSATDTGKCGLFGGTGIVIDGGTISFDGKGIVSSTDVRKANGFKADDQDGADTRNYITINGGSVSITSDCGKGIAASNVTIAGGQTKVIVTGNEIDGLTGSWYDADGVKQTSTSTDPIKLSPKGIEGEASLTISGGDIFVKSSKTGIDTEGKLAVSGGRLVVSAEKSAIRFGDGDAAGFVVTGSSATIFALGRKKMVEESESLPTSCVINKISTVFEDKGTDSLSVEGIIGISEPLEYKAALLISPDLAEGASAADFVQSETFNGSDFGTEFITGSGVYIPN